MTNRDRLLALFCVVVLALGAWWLRANTTWVDVRVPRPATGAARDNPVYAYEQLLGKLGMHAAHFEALDRMPPEHARLVLLSSEWSLLPERAEQIHQWVLRGGHLVLVNGSGWEDTPLKDWITIRPYRVIEKPSAASAAQAASAAASSDDEDDEDDEDEDEDDADEAARAQAAHRPGPRRPVPTVVSVPPLLGEVPSAPTCDLFSWSSRLYQPAGTPHLWRVTGERGTQALRAAAGQGTVTVLNLGKTSFMNEAPLRCSQPLVHVHAVQGEPGATVWIYLNEKREPLIPWLWHQGWIVIAVGLLALAATLWRRAVRFGPRMAPAPRLRRSIAEQVRGLGAYLHRHGRDALLAAQQRALDETAARTLPGYSRLPRPQQAREIAAATRLPADALATALFAKTCTRAELPQRLQLLESARRRLQRPQDERKSP